MASGDTLAVFVPYQNEPPSSNYATAGLRNGHPTLQFDDTTSWAAIFTSVLPRNYSGGGLTVSVHYSAIATSGTIAWTGEVERMDDNSLDIDADSFASAQSSSNKTVPGTSGQTDLNTIAHTSGANMDSLAAGEQFRYRLKRDVATDNAVGNAEITAIEVKET